MTADEAAESAVLQSELAARGYVPVADHKLQVGHRVRHGGQRYARAYQTGTGTVLAVMELTPSPWVAAGWGTRDIELLVLLDKPWISGTRFMRVADYHVALAEEQPA